MRLHQECTYFTYLKFFQPLFGSQYHIRCSLKASHVSEGCLMMLRKEAFQVPKALLNEAQQWPSSCFKASKHEMRT